MRALRLLLPLVFLVTACAEGQDDPTSVHDLRVLGMRFEPPEVLMPGCDPRLLAAAAQLGSDGGVPTVPPQLQQLLARYAAAPLRFTALVADPQGAGRTLTYRLTACANRSDRECDAKGDSVVLEEGTFVGGEELSTTMAPGVRLLDDGQATPLLLEVIAQDTYKGLGGVRLPVVLEVSAPDTGERIFAQKLMVYSCQFFPTQRQNVTPVLPGLLWEGEPWPEDEVREHSGTAAVALTPEDFSALEEPYVVPSLQLQPVDLVESWKIAWHTSSGTMSTYTTGGSNFAGEVGRHRVKWEPDRSATGPRDVTFWLVVRDGRGGNSWTRRTVRWTP